MDTFAPHLPADADPQTVFADFERRARRVETPCGDGAMVWRAWGEGPPLLLLHGAQGGWAHWIRNIDALAEARTVWAPDLPGHGDSAMPVRTEHEAICAALASGIRTLVGAERPLDIVGFSFGGVVGAHLARLHPELVRRLILVGTGGLDTPLGHVEVRRARGLEGEARRAAIRANLLSIMLHDPDSADDLAVHIQAAIAPRGRLKPTALVLPDRLSAVLPEVKAQVDAIWGECDNPHPAPEVQEAALRRSHPDLHFRVIGGAGHWCMYEQPAAFNRAVLELLDQPLRPARAMK